MMTSECSSGYQEVNFSLKCLTDKRTRLVNFKNNFVANKPILQTISDTCDTFQHIPTRSATFDALTFATNVTTRSRKVPA